MSGNVKFRWFLLAPILVALFVVISPVVSWAGELEDAQKKVRQNYKSTLGTNSFDDIQYIRVGFGRGLLLRTYRDNVN